MNELTHVDLFSGIGGFSLAAEWAGFRTVAFCEIDDYCQKVLKRHWPEAPCVPDIRDFKWPLADTPCTGGGRGKESQCEGEKTSLGSITLLTGGFPCQPFSCAGKRRGTADDRYLWPEMLRVIQEAQPDWVIGENVTNIVKMALDDVIADLETINYTVQPFDISADSANLPTLERHIWIIATTNSQRSQGSIGNALSKQSGISPELPRDYQRITDRWSISSSRVCGVGEGIPNRVDRLKSLGNAIVPHVAAEIMRGIIEISCLRTILFLVTFYSCL